MSNTVITNYTDLNGPSTKADNSVVVIVNKDGSLSVDQKLLGTLMGTDGSQAAGISVVRVGHEGRPDDATDSETEDENVPHVTLSVDSYYDEPNSIIKYDSGAEMLQSLRIETRENSLVGFHNDHCYTPLTSPSQVVSQKSDSFSGFDDPVIEITHTPPPKPVSNSKKITILEEKVIPKGKKIVISSSDTSLFLKGKDVLNKQLPVVGKSKIIHGPEKNLTKNEENIESSSFSSSGDSIPDRDSDSDYKETKDRLESTKLKKSRLKPRILKNVKSTKVEPKVAVRIKSAKNIIKKDLKEKNYKNITEKKQTHLNLSTSKEGMIEGVTVANTDPIKQSIKQTKHLKKEKKTPAHVTALLSDMTSLFSTPDVIRRVSTDLKTDSKVPSKPDKDILKKSGDSAHPNDEKQLNVSNIIDNTEKTKMLPAKSYGRQKDKILNPSEKVVKNYDSIPQLDDMSLAQILQDPSNITKTQPNITTVNAMNSPGLAGPLSPTLDLLGGIQPEEEGLTEDLLMHVAQLVESSENLQEVIDKQVLGKVDSVPHKTLNQSLFQQTQSSNNQNNAYNQITTKTMKSAHPRKDPIEIVRRDGRIITLPPIEAPATRSSKRKTQIDTNNRDVLEVLAIPPAPTLTVVTTPEPQVQQVSKQYINKKLTNKKHEPVAQPPVEDKTFAESQESWNSEDDPYRLWCICRQPHNNRFMICCDSCEDWFHGKCVNITKAMGQQMEEQGIEWRCPNCVKKLKTPPKPSKTVPVQPTLKRQESTDKISPSQPTPVLKSVSSKNGCIVCKKSARASSIYCSDACILKHAQDSLGNQTTPTKLDSETENSIERLKNESRVIVYERKTGRLLAGPNAPTAENLKSWLQKNPTFEVVRPGALSAIKPNTTGKRAKEINKVQTTLNFEKIPKKVVTQTATILKTPQQEPKESPLKILTPSKDLNPSSKELNVKSAPQPKTPMTPKTPPTVTPPVTPKSADTPKTVAPPVKPATEPRKIARAVTTRSQPTHEKAPSVSPATPRRKDNQDNNKMKMDSSDQVRENVRKGLHEQISLRMAENKESDLPKFTEEEIQQFVKDTELELHELFKDVGMKYKAKYRSLMFNIKDRKNLTLWEKICERKITPDQLVRLSPEELASQELAQWRDKEAKYQLELIKKSELDLLAASKTYVLKTHKGEEVMETKKSVSTELDPNVPVEDLVTALNDKTVGPLPEISNAEEISTDNASKKKEAKEKKKNKEDSKKKRRESKRVSENRKSRSSRRSSTKEKEQRSTWRSEKRSRKDKKSPSKERKVESTKDKLDTNEQSKQKSKSKRRSRSSSRSTSRSLDRERTKSRERSKRRSRSRESSKYRHRSRSKHRSSIEDKGLKRSKSQDHQFRKEKNDSPSSDSIERPKSAMLKEIHPEYDPHEPMITSAFSEEDLRKSREDVYEENYKNDGDYDDPYDPSRDFSINTTIMTSTEEHIERRVSEVESDQEPSSTVESSAATVWNGCINMVDVARFYVAAHEVSGNAADIEEDLSTELDVVGRINPDTVWEYIGKMKRTSNKDIVVLRLHAANDEERMQYIALYSYLSSRNRLGVVKVCNTTTVKDLYIVPVSAQGAVPAALLPLEGPGLGEPRSHLLLAIVIRQRKRRHAHSNNHHQDIAVVPTKMARECPSVSYTPPLVAGGGPGSLTPPGSPRRRPKPLSSYSTPVLSATVKDQIAASLAAAEDDEPYSPGSSSSSGSVLAPAVIAAPAATYSATSTLRTKMEELNRQIEEQKQQIRKMAQADSSIEEEEAYSPSRPMTPPERSPTEPAGVSTPHGLADIALPSNLQEILATIKQRAGEAAP